MLPLATFIERFGEIVLLTTGTAAIWSGAASAYKWLRGGTNAEVQEAAKAAAPPGFIVGVYLAVAYEVYLVLS